MIGRKNQFVQIIAWILLGLFFIIAMFMTFLSQRNYYNNLAEVKVIQPETKALEYTVEYMAKPVGNNVNMIQWQMEKLGEFIEVEDLATVYEVHIENTSNIYGEITPIYVKGNFTIGKVTNIIYDEDIQKYTIQAQVENASTNISDEKILMVVITLQGAICENVVPISCIISPRQASDSFAIYVVEDVPKIWGIAKTIKRVPITVLETNGVEAAIRNYSGGDIVMNAESSLLSGGQDVRVAQ